MSIPCDVACCPQNQFNYKTSEVIKLQFHVFLLPWYVGKQTILGIFYKNKHPLYLKIMKLIGSRIIKVFKMAHMTFYALDWLRLCDATIRLFRTIRLFTGRTYNNLILYIKHVCSSQEYTSDSIISPVTAGGRHRSGGSLPHRSREVAMQLRTTYCGPYLIPNHNNRNIYNIVRSLHMWWKRWRFVEMFSSSFIPLINRPIRIIYGF